MATAAAVSVRQESRQVRKRVHDHCFCRKGLGVVPQVKLLSTIQVALHSAPCQVAPADSDRGFGWVDAWPVGTPESAH